MIWAGILANPDIDNDTDFFGAGAGSMDVARYTTWAKLGRVLIHIFTEIRLISKKNSSGQTWM